MNRLLSISLGLMLFSFTAQAQTGTTLEPIDINKKTPTHLIPNQWNLALMTQQIAMIANTKAVTKQ